MDKRCLISYAKNGREPYEDALDRGMEEAKKHYDGDFIFLKDALPNDCPSHLDVPYSFKPYSFMSAFEKGYRQVIWMDSTIMMLRDPKRMFGVLKDRGILAFHNLGHPLAKWISDIAVQTTGIDLSQNPQQIMACVVGFDIDHPKGLEIFEEWFMFSRDGKSFQNNPSSYPGFIGHRHDQAILSALLHQHKIKLLPYGNLIYEAHYPDGYEGRTPYFLNKGIK